LSLQPLFKGCVVAHVPSLVRRNRELLLTLTRTSHSVFACLLIDCYC
jgi:hypothetical protein